VIRIGSDVARAGIDAIRLGSDVRRAGIDAIAAMRFAFAVGLFVFRVDPAQLTSHPFAYRRGRVSLIQATCRPSGRVVKQAPMRHPIFLCLLAPLAATACSAAPDDGARASSDPITVTSPVIANVHVTATASAVTVTYTRLSGGPFTVSLAGATGTTTLPEGSVSGATGATFTGLLECTPFVFSILSAGATIGSGNIHTLQTGGVACPATETLASTEGDQFEAAYHWRNNAPYCYPSNWNPGYRSFPLGEPGWFMQGGVATGPTTASVGYTHYWQPGADPFPCQEQVVWVYRSRIGWKLDASRARRVQKATLQATLTSPKLCVSDFAEMSKTVWDDNATYQSAVNDYGQPWDYIFPPTEGVGRGLIRIGTVAPLALNGTTVTADVTAQAQGGHVSGGFAAANDGFPIPNGFTPAHTDYPQDNNDCQTGLSSIALALAYSPITPDTPMNCAATLYCDQFSVTCDAAPEAFQVHQTINGFDRVVGTAQGSPGAPVTISGTQLAPVPFFVCAVAGSLSSCTSPIPTTVAETCNSGGGGNPGSSSGGGSCPPGRPCRLQ
jgi:hypothetical protein